MNQAVNNKIEIMQAGGKILANMLAKLRSMIKPGLDVYDLEIAFIDMCSKANAYPACKGYRVAGLPAFPTGLCIGVNSESVHCYPKKGEILKEGDIVAVDTVIKYQGYHVDSAITVAVGEVSQENQRFINTAKLAANSAFKEAIVGNHIGDIGYAMSSIMRIAGYNVLVDFVGHGIGEKMHQYPDIPCYGKKGQGLKLEDGMTLAIEEIGRAHV